MELLKRVRAAGIAPVFLIRWTFCLFLIFFFVPQEIVYAQDDDEGEIFWGEEDEEEEIFEDEDEEFLDDDEEFDEDPDSFFDEEEDEDEFYEDEGEFEEEEFDEEMSSTDLSDVALKMGYTLTLHGASPALVSHSLYTYNSFVNFRLGVEMPILMQVGPLRFRLGAELGTVKFEDYYPPAKAAYSGMTLIGLVSVPAGASQVKVGGGLVSGGVGIVVESTYGFTIGNTLGLRLGMRYTGSPGAKNSEQVAFEGPASWLEGVLVLAVTL